MGVSRTPSAGTIVSARRDSVAAPRRGGAGRPVPLAESPARRCWFCASALSSPAPPLPRMSLAPRRRRLREHWRRNGAKVKGCADFAPPTLLMQSSKSKLRHGGVQAAAGWGGYG